MTPPPETNVTPLQAGETRKRSLSTASDLAADDSQNHKKMKQPVASVHSRCRPSLQTLPLELLESIFVYSTNLALPRSSPSLGAKLSGKTTLLRVFMMAFHDTWDHCFGKPENWSDSTGAPIGDVSLQSDLLSTPWVNVDFILEAQQAWADKYARGRRYRHHEHEGLLTQRLYRKNIRARNRYFQHALEHELKLWKFEARACFEADYERALHFPPMPFGALTGSLGGSADIHPHVRIPVNLVTGPWDEEKKRLLFWLVRAGARVRDDDKEDFWKVKVACLDAAVISPQKVDPLIINCLMGPWIYTALPKDAADERLAKLSRRIDQRKDKRDMRDVLRFLIKGMDKDRQYLFHDYSDDDLDEDEEVLDDDAMDAIFAAQYFDEMENEEMNDEQGDEFGHE
ncbi:uncharacterized protein CPUR_08070 [Claviceps purpurea 20.1]|uniref:Uncharacterized protein n=1 Tax=Claviceps purpurea (strain 20.1) TaxID=1111077 RepID=M1WG14_CLAP2|nr:uncharacterized protein CPUR_08070 [Claviceps purpurea 20.1]